MAENRIKGRGWFGNSAEHSKAGRKGGRARARNLREKKNKSQNNNIHTALMDQDEF